MHRNSVLQAIISVVLGIAVFGPHVAFAQGTSDSPSGLTVTGYGQASAPAETATLQIIMGAPNFAPPQAPRPGSTPGAEEREAVAPVVRSLVDAGIPEDEITVIVGPFIGEMSTMFGPATAVIQFDVTDPTIETITQLVNAAGAGGAEEQLLVSQIVVAYDVADCAALEREAREHAIADAREQADIEAELLDVTAGELLAFRDVPIGPESAYQLLAPLPIGHGCTPVEQDGLLIGGYGNPTFDPTQEPTVTVHAQVEMTFEMPIGSDATPAP